MATTKKYEVTGGPLTLDSASYEVRLTDDGITVSNIKNIDPGTLYAKSGSTSVKINDTPCNLAVEGSITSVEDAAAAIKSILYVLKASDNAASNEEITGTVVNIGGEPHTNLSFAELVNVY